MYKCRLCFQEKGNFVTFLGQITAKNGSSLTINDGTGDVQCDFDFEDIVEDLEVNLKTKIT